MKQIKPSNDTKVNSYNLRIFLLLSAIVIFIGLTIIRLFTLQVVNHAYYQAKASNQHGSQITIKPKRGEIFLTPVGLGQPLLVATNLTKNTVYANPKQMVNPDNVAAKLAPLLELSVVELSLKFKARSNYVPIKKQLSDDVSAKIKSLNIPGISLAPEDFRFYPQKNLASQVLGFLGFKADQRVGQYGIEEKYEKQLAGEKGAAGNVIFPDRDFLPAVDGDDIYLTLDPAIQFKAQEVLDTAVAKHGAESGSVIVLEPKTGAVLAMASAPDFDLNNYGKVEDLSTYANRAIAADYEPGSVFKAITMAAAINEGKVTPETTYDDAGIISVDDKQIRNSDGKAHGTQNMIQVLDESLNTGAVFAQQQIGNETFKKYVQKFGFGKRINFELLGETFGNIDNLNKKGDIFFATASFGQGITATPLQLIQSYSAIANGGKIMKPYIVNRIVYPDGTEDVTEPMPGEFVIEPKTAATISAMLVDVVENGHGKQAHVKGYYIAGKTGTAQVAFKDKVGYNPNQNIGTFIGFGPVDNPQFVMLVRIDSPKDVKFAEATAAPAFGEIAGFILNYLQVPPSRQ